MKITSVFRVHFVIAALLAIALSLWVAPIARASGSGTPNSMLSATVSPPGNPVRIDQSWSNAYIVKANHRDDLLEAFAAIAIRDRSMTEATAAAWNDLQREQPYRRQQRLQLSPARAREVVSPPQLE